MKKVSTELILLGLSILGVFLFFPVNTMLLTYVLAGVAYLVTRSYTVALGVLIAMAAFHTFNVLMKPTVAVPVYSERRVLDVTETFQPRDPISIHQRIAANKVEQPLKPKVPTITGVLESPEILSSFEVRSMGDEDRGAAGSALPADLGANTRIHTVPESFVPNEVSGEKRLMEPFLQDGPDVTAVLTALIKKGTEMKTQPASELAALPGM